MTQPNSALNSTPIVIDPEIRHILTAKPPTMRDFERAARDHERVWYDSAQPETIDDLITVLEGLRDELGGGTEVRNEEGGYRLYVSASKYDDGTSIVRL